MKMIKTSCGLMTPFEAKMIGDIDRDEKIKKRKEQKMEVKNVEINSIKP